MVARRCRVKNAANVTAEDKAAYNLVLWGTAGVLQCCNQLSVRSIFGFS